VALTLQEAAKLETDLLRKGVIETFASESPVLRYLPFIEVEGNSFRYARTQALPGVEFRSVNQPYTESTATFDQRSENLVILGGVADVDRYLQQTRGSVNDQRAIQTELKVKALALAFTREFFHGDSTANPNSFDGLDQRVTAGQTIVAGVDGAPLDLDMMDQLVDAVVGGPDVIFMNRNVRRQLTKLARQSTLIQIGFDDFGRSVFRYDGVPIEVVDKDEQGADILGFNETQGTNTTTCSVWAVRFGADQFVAGITNGGIQVEDLGLLSNPPVYRTLIEWYVGLAVFRDDAIARLKGIVEV